MESTKKYVAKTGLYFRVYEKKTKERLLSIILKTILSNTVKDNILAKTMFVKTSFWKLLPSPEYEKSVVGLTLRIGDYKVSYILNQNTDIFTPCKAYVGLANNMSIEDSLEVISFIQERGIGIE